MRLQVTYGTSILSVNMLHSYANPFLCITHKSRNLFVKRMKIEITEIPVTTIQLKYTA
jgi:hypothetical protein